MLNISLSSPGFHPKNATKFTSASGRYPFALKSSTETSAAVYTNVLLFIKNTARYNIKIAEVHIKQDGITEFVTRDQTRLITSVFDKFEQGFANLIALFEKEVLRKEALNEVEYIDLRFGNKVFYKNKTN